ncbi:GMC oxidoreductase-domain-containing protein [Leucosporidium creatinivorum]|uniref:GMC oxidoreductase-domain-containing protein n=1 Tax=Leucosporidium creatinivorum TaxID=106004 RepID=A0A1Y2EPU0_9BASI|nr:GMC oxidoreductase-domain-containing protein [Leucosporidium creatinivorum]
MRSTLLLASAMAFFVQAEARVWGYIDTSNHLLLPTVLKQSYDFIVVGGGNTGLAVASRLSEDKHKTVLVIEAGTSQVTNAGVSIPAEAGSTFLSDIDWAFYTAPQKKANNRSVYWPRGKMLGGSSGLNFLAWTRPNEADMTSIVNMAGTGASSWSWKHMLSYFKKSESYTSPTANNQGVKRVDVPSVHGHAKVGVSASYPPYLSSQFVGFFKGLRELRVEVDQDLSDGQGEGVSYSASSMDPITRSRETSDTAYIVPIVAGRTNLVVLTSAQATKLTWASKKSGSNVVASGVNFVATAKNHTTLHVTAKAEVILSAGSIQTPQLLELSGVGDPSILNPLGISTVVNLPGVGANLQDHPGVVVVEKLKPAYQSLDNLSGVPLATAVGEYALGQGLLTQELSVLAYLTGSSFLTKAEQAEALALSKTPNAALPKKQQAQMIANLAAGSPVVEFLSINVYFGESASGATNESYISLASCIQHSFSRGSIHISTADPLTAPTIDPSYLQHPFDMFILSKAAQFMRKVAQKTSLSKFISGEAEPGTGVQSECEWEEYVRESIRTEYHPIGTASMMPRAEKGVVDPRLTVYGTSNVRVADLSILPLHVSTHPQSLAYAIGEKAAAMILADHQDC